MSKPENPVAVRREATGVPLGSTQARPFVKWAGGKRTLVPEIARLLPATFNEYWEPFVGGGAVFFALGSRFPRAHLSDTNRDLVIAYQVIQDNPEPLIGRLEHHAEMHSPDHYSAVREQHDQEDRVAIAARFIYLNKTAYNGLFRVNRAGRFNVPIGRYENPTICDADNLRAVSVALQRATLLTRSFDESGITPREDDVVYCDPPYDGTFTGYTGSGFGEEEQTALRDQATVWAEAGAHVILSNNDTPFIRTLYKSWRIVEVQAPRHINSNGAGRNKVGELLITHA